MKKKFLGLCILCLFCTMLLAGCKNKEQEESILPPTQDDSKQYLSGKHYAQIDVANYGLITLELNADAAPATVTNFINLIQENFYDGLSFHRVINGFMIQGGDPDANGSGGSGVTIPGEFSLNGFENPISHLRGTISMARTNDDYNSASSQFFIVQQDTTTLDGSYAAFGKVLYGMDVVDEISAQTMVADSNGTVLLVNQPVINSIYLIDENVLENLRQQEIANLPAPTATISFSAITSTEGLKVTDSWIIDENGQTHILFSSTDLLSIGIYKTDLAAGMEYDASSPLGYYSNIKANEYIFVTLNLVEGELPTLLLVTEEPSGAIGQYLLCNDEFYGGAYLVPVQ